MRQLILIFVIAVNLFGINIARSDHGNKIYQSNQILAIGHRGFAGKYQENSLQAFDQASKLGVDGVELDVWVCKTGELVVYHDRMLERLTHVSAKISDQTFAQLRKLKLPNGAKIPTLNEVLQIVNRKCIVN